jgi:hypothetical protein
MSIKSFGVRSIKLGDIPTDGAEAGGMATVLAAWGNTYKDSATYDPAEDTVFDIMVEEFDEPDDDITTRGKAVLTFDLIDYDPQVLKKAFGGTVSADGLSWEEPLEVEKIEQSVLAEQTTGLLLGWPRMRIRAKVIPALKKGDVGRVRLMCEKRRPAKAGLAAFKITKPAA